QATSTLVPCSTWITWAPSPAPAPPSAMTALGAPAQASPVPPVLTPPASAAPPSPDILASQFPSSLSSSIVLTPASLVGLAVRLQQLVPARHIDQPPPAARLCVGDRRRLGRPVNHLRGALKVELRAPRAVLAVGPGRYHAPARDELHHRRRLARQ